MVENVDIVRGALNVYMITHMIPILGHYLSVKVSEIVWGTCLIFLFSRGKLQGVGFVGSVFPNWVGLQGHLWGLVLL